MKYAIYSLLILLVAIMAMTAHYYQIAYETKPVLNDRTIVYRGYGVMRWSPRSHYHIIVGYDAENVQIQAPPNDNVIADGEFVVREGFHGNALINVGSDATGFLLRDSELRGGR